MNATWPFAKLHATTEYMTISLGVFGMSLKTFDFARADVTSIRKKDGAFSVGALVEHSRANHRLSSCSERLTSPG